ncbi:MAG: phytoene desaturase family protein [Patescibacteria group bacterium]
MSKIIIIGAGIGGLATANLLAKAGHTVHVYEKEPSAGGRSGQFKKDGFTFDTGPSWYLMPEVFDHYFNLLDTTAAKQLDLIKLNPAYKVFFENNNTITITSDLEKDAATFESIETGAGEALKKYVEKSDETYQLALKHFLYSNFTDPRDLFHSDITKRVAQMLSLVTTSIDRYVSRFVTHQHLKQILEYPMVFLGTSPFNAPAMYSLMSALDFKEGVYYPRGTMYSVVESLVALGKNLGVSYHFNSPVKRIVVSSDFATGIELEDGAKIEGDQVISNADLHFTETQLLAPAERSYPESYWNKKETSPSALLLFLGVKGKVPEFEHHTLLFVEDWKANFDAIYKTKTAPEKASLYISKTSQSDASTAPKGHENIFVLVPLPAGMSLSEKQTQELTMHYLNQIKTMTGVDLESRIVSKTTFGPDDFRTKYHSWQASMLGPSHKLTQSAFFRTPNKSKKVSSLYYVGSGTVPGVGVPMCLISAELIYKRLAGIKKGGRVEAIEEIS